MADETDYQKLVDLANETAAAKVRARYPQHERPPALAPYVIGNLLKNAAGGIASLPQRAFEEAQQTPWTGTGSALPQDTMPAGLQAALLTMGATPFGKDTAGPGFTLGAGARRGRGRREEAAYEAPPPMGHNMPPEPIVVDVSAPKRAAITANNLRDLPLDEAINIARTEKHIIPSPTRDAYVGAPAWVKTPVDLAKMRADFDAQVARGIEGADWYPRAQAGILETAGPDRDKQHLTARELAVTSAQATPETNLGFALSMRNSYEAGLPVRARTGQQARAYQASRDAERDIGLGKKTGIYAGHLDPTVVDPTTGTNDIWHARAFGFPTHMSTLKEQQHAFLDAETLLAVDRANKAKLGGRSDWTAGEIQAAPWVAGKAEGMAAKRDMDLPTALAEASKTYPNYFDKHSAFGTHEATPGVGIGHLPQLAEGSYADRAAFAADPRSTWQGPAGRDIIYDAFNMYTRPSRQATGVFQGPKGLEINPAEVARPMVSFGPRVKGSVDVDPASRGLMDAGEAFRAYVDAQNAGAWHIPLPHAKAGEATSAFIPANRPLTVPEITQLRERGGRFGLPDIIDTGQGATVTSFGDKPSAAQVRQNISQLGGVIRGGGVPQRVGVASGYRGYEDAFRGGEGSGAATRQLFEYLDSPNAPAAFAQLDRSPAIREAARARLERDAELAAKTGQPVRADIQRARDILSKDGLTGLLDALRRGVPLPAVALAVLQQALQEQPAD